MASIATGLLALGFAFTGAGPAQAADPVATHTTLTISPAGGAFAGQELTFDVIVTADDGLVPAGGVSISLGGGCGSGTPLVSAELPADGHAVIHTTASPNHMQYGACFFATDHSSYNNSDSGYQNYTTTKTPTHAAMTISPVGGAFAGQQLTFDVTVTADNGLVPAGSVSINYGGPCGGPLELTSADLPADGHVVLHATADPNHSQYAACVHATDQDTYINNEADYQNYTTTKTPTHAAMTILPAGGAFAGQQLTFDVTVTADNGLVPAGSVSIDYGGPCGGPLELTSADLPADGHVVLHATADPNHFQYAACVHATDQDTYINNEADYQNYTTTTAVKPTLSGTPPAGAINEPYAFTFTHTGVPSSTVAKSAGTLPPGLTLNSSGHLSGTPTKAGTYHFTVQATNVAGSASKAVTLVVYPAPVIVAYGANVKESNAGTQPLAFRLTLNRASKLSVTVHYATANGSAKAGTDFVGASGTLTFSPGQTSKTVTVGVKGDRVHEPNEVFYLLLYSPVHAGIKTSSAVGGILNDD